MKPKTFSSFLLILFLFLSAESFSQKISVEELKKLHASDWDTFDTFVLTKGYEYSSSKDDRKYTLKSYAYNETADTMASRFISKYVNNYSSSGIVTWQTSKNFEYLWFKNQLISKGFKFIESGQFKKSTFLKYINGKLQLKLYVSKGPDANGKEIPVYEISISDN